MSGVLLRELVSRWVECSGGFRVRTRVVQFTTLGVCFALGLRIEGKPVSLGEHGDCHVKSLFKGEDITVDSTVEKLKVLNNDDDVEDFCRVYILLAFSMFYFPRTTPSAAGVSLNLLDELDALKKYSWGVAVYDFLVGSLSRAATHYNESRNGAPLHVAGCATALQIWAVQNLSLRPTSKSTRFPCFLRWTQIEGGKSKLMEAFKGNKLVKDLVASEEDRQDEVLAEVMNEAKGGFHRWKNRILDMHDLLSEHEMLIAQDKDF